MEQMNINTSDYERSFQDVKDGKHVYHYEYTNIHNQRIALVRLMHLWHQIGFPAAYAIFAFFFGYGIKQKYPLFFFVGAILSTLVVFFVRRYALSLDQSVIRLYPRIIAIEIMLDYHFYRNYLRNKGSSEKDFVETCESIEAQSPGDLWKKINCEFKPDLFPSYRRGHGILNKAAWLIGISFWIIALFATIYVTQIVTDCNNGQ
jgi:hypothetical protein